MTVGNSRPFALWSVISHTRAFCDPCCSSASDSRDRRSTKPPSDGSGSRPSYSRAADTSSARFSMRAFGIFVTLVAQVLQVAASIEDLADRDGYRILARDVGERDEQVAKRRKRCRGARWEQFLVEAPNQTRPQRVRRNGRLQAGAEQREVECRQLQERPRVRP